MLDWLAERWNAFVNFCYSCLLTLSDLLKDLACFLLDGVFALVLHVVNGFSVLFSSFNVVQYISMIPEETQQIMALVGVNEASSIIVAAISIRLLLQIIPFTRLGS